MLKSLSRPQLFFILAAVALLLFVAYISAVHELSKAWARETLARDTRETRIVKQNLQILQQSYLDEMAKAKPSSSVHHELAPKYSKLIDCQLDQVSDPAALSSIALWVQNEDPWFSSKCPVYSMVFFESAQRLSRLHNSEGRKQLHELQSYLEATSHFDGHIAEELLEIQQK
jgi:hypothetical protein